jgi:hypothetical protein
MDFIGWNADVGFIGLRLLGHAVWTLYRGVLPSRKTLPAVSSQLLEEGEVGRTHETAEDPNQNQHSRDYTKKLNTYETGHGIRQFFEL